MWVATTADTATRPAAKALPPVNLMFSDTNKRHWKVNNEQQQIVVAETAAFMMQ